MSTVNWNKLSRRRPQLGFFTKVGAVPRDPAKKKYKPKLHTIGASSYCREQINSQIRSRVTNISCRRQDPTYWASPLSKRFDIDLDLEQLHQPDVTNLWIHVSPSAPKRHKSYYRNLIETTDALTGLTCLVLNPNRYCGNWWRTPLPNSKKTTSVFSWYGTDNFFLAHPAITSMVLGLFRQSAALTAEDIGPTLQILVPRAEVRKALDASDHERALYLIKRLKPLIVSPGKTRFFPIREAHFDFLFDLHQSIYKHGLKKVFGELTDAWNVEGNYWTSPGGSYSYFGSQASGVAAQKIKKMV